MHKLKDSFRLLPFAIVVAVLLGLFSSFGGKAIGAASAATDQKGLPLARVLKSDGTLSIPIGFSGAIDPRGWQLATGLDAAPRFVPRGSDRDIVAPNAADGPTAVGDENWDNRFYLAGAKGSGVVAFVGSDMYLGGSFKAIGRFNANTIAKWDGSRWATVGGGVDGSVSALAVIGNDLYVGGTFTHAGGIAANNIAKWNGSTWAALGSGVAGSVFSLAAYGSDLYVGGQFVQAGSVTAWSVAKWNGSGWSALSTGTLHPNCGPSCDLHDAVYALTFIGSDLYAGGGFQYAGSKRVNYVAKWNGSTWSALGEGLSGYNPFFYNVFALTVSGTDLYAGGDFETAGGQDASHVAKWDGHTWSSLGSDFNGTDEPVYSLAAIGSNVYVGGEFTAVYNSGESVVHANNIAMWTGSAWSALGSGVDRRNMDAKFPFVSTMTVHGIELYVGGLFVTAGGTRADYLAKWNGSRWLQIVSGGAAIDLEARALAVSGSDIYAGGLFSQAGGLTVNNVAKWNGSTWLALGDGVPPSRECFIQCIVAMVASGEDLYVGGSITDNLARWDGTSWSILGATLDGEVSALAISGSDLYVGGSFTKAGGRTVNYIAKWDGRVWSALGSGVNGGVAALLVSGSDLYVGGGFTRAGNVSANNIARWNGSSWSALGDGVNNVVLALAGSGSNLYAGGDFTQTGGTSAQHIAHWNGSAWSALGSGVDARVWTLAFSAGNLYVGGDFAHAGGVDAAAIARWSGGAWSTLGSGIGGYVTSLALSGRDLYASGGFEQAGGKPSVGIALWHIPVGTPTPTITPTSAATMTPSRTATAIRPTVTSTPVPFIDVPVNTYYYLPVQYLAARGAISGYNTSPPCPANQTPCFNPFANTTRAQVVKIVLIAEGYQLVAPDHATFSDVPQGSPFFSFVETAVANRIVGGYTDGTFRPAAFVTRGQLAKIVALASAWQLENPVSATFSDVPVGSPFFSFVETAAQKGAISGYDCGVGCLEFRPANNAIRAQIAKIVYNALAATK